jgi:parallel beta-helix repeat protein
MLITRKWLVVGIILLFLGTCIIPSIGQNVENTQATSRGDWLYVGGSGPGNYTRIQDAINDSNDGDTVFVYDDSSPYYEFLIINKSISLIGENKDTTIIRGYNNIEQHNIQINANGIHLHGFSIQNSTFVNNQVISYYGISISSNNNDISGNILTYDAGGILITHASRNIIYENIIINGSFYCQAIRVTQGWNNDIFDNSIAGVGFGVVIYDSAFNKIHGNNLRKIKYDGISITKTNPWKNTMCNKIYKNYISGAETGILLLYWCCFNNIFSNEITNCSTYGIERRDTFFVFIWENNFINNSCNAYFFSNGIMNQWSRNYWDDWNESGYYTIKGEAINIMDWEGDPIPIEQYDKHPAQEPYNIGV